MNTKTTKKVTKKFKPEFTVDLTAAKTPAGIYANYCIAKAKAGIAVTDMEIESLISVITNSVIDTLFTDNNAAIKTKEGSILRVLLEPTEKESPKNVENALPHEDADKPIAVGRESRWDKIKKIFKK